MTQDEWDRLQILFQEEERCIWNLQTLNNANRHKMDAIPVCFRKMIKKNTFYIDLQLITEIIY
jgi:hypothetical protein